MPRAPLSGSHPFAPDTAAWHTMRMDGMFTDEEIKTLDSSKGVAFDRAFLIGTEHHEGALKMVDDLFPSTGAGQEVDANVFANDVVTTQTVEIGLCAPCSQSSTRSTSGAPHRTAFARFNPTTGL